ncbi:MAG: thioredoxin family protein [Anaerolineae bacterium]|jgi:thiol-disulfide isomerase/thioredoxin|nr:thioredoxin family protein [Anaerolineae bacterium]
MSKQRPSDSREKQRTSKLPLTLWQIGVLVGVVALVIVVFWLKGRSTAAESGIVTPAVLVTPMGDAVAVTPEPVVLSDSTPETPIAVQSELAQRAGESLEAYLDRMLEAGQPIFAFFHSYTCAQCVEMDQIVQQVYPDFAGKVVLVDANVYDDANRSLLQRARIQVIPTLVFIDRTGAGEGYTGVMPAAQLEEKLTALSEGGAP